MRIPFFLREHGEGTVPGEEVVPMTVPGEEVSPGVGVESHSILHCELLEEEVHTGLTHTLHTAQQFYWLDGFDRLALVRSVIEIFRVL